MDYAQAIEFLHRLQIFGARPGLASTRRLASLVGNPQEGLQFLHVAGTNGKGSTCAMLESICRAAGLKVGLFTSPHLVSFRERIQINRRLIEEKDVAALVGELRPHLEREFSSADHPTFFEVVTIMALLFFSRRHVDVVIWETGLGGRLDATNIVTPLVSVITNVQLDHEQWLGSTRAAIAAEKAGIIKPGIPVVTSAGDREALEVIVETARRNDAPLTVIGATHAEAVGSAVSLPLAGGHQRLNAALALAAVDAAGSKLLVSEESCWRGLREVQWAGRFQEVRRGSRVLVLDGAHNPAGIQALREVLGERFPGVKPCFIFAAMKDKDWAAMASGLGDLVGRVLLCRIGTERSAQPEELVGAFRGVLGDGAAVEICGSLAEALARSEDCPLTVITGSLYFVGEACQALGISAGADERGLNEWGSASK